MDPKTDGIRKAAIVTASLDRQTADRLLEHMAPQQAAEIRRAMVELGEIDPQEQRRIIDEFFRIEPLVPQRDPPGIELDGLLSRTLSLGDSPTCSDPWADQEGGDAEPFGFLREAEADKLARILVAERPQMIALVLSHLPPEQAGSVLIRFAPALQVDVIRRLVDLEETEPEILREVEQALRLRLSEQIRMQRRRTCGLSAVAGILEASSGRVSGQILDNLASHDWQLAEKLGPEPLEFSDLARLDNPALAAVFEAADPELMILALVGAPPALIERFLTGLRQSEAKLIRHKLDHLGPTRLSDVEEARRHIADLARRLAVQGRISLPRPSKAASYEPQNLTPAA